MGSKGGDGHASDNELAGRPSAWLQRHGGWLLCGLGIALIALATVFVEQVAVAPIFAIGGIGLTVLGVVLPRVQGQMELGTNGFKFFLAEIGRQAVTLSPEAKAEVLDEIVERANELERLRESAPSKSRSVAERMVISATRGADLERKAVTWLRAQGWNVEQDARGPGIHFDAVAVKEGERLIVEVKAGVRSAPQLIAQARRLKDAAVAHWGPELRFALLLGEHPPHSMIARLASEGLEVYAEAGEGFERLA